MVMGKCILLHVTVFMAIQKHAQNSPYIETENVEGSVG